MSSSALRHEVPLTIRGLASEHLSASVNRTLVGGPERTRVASSITSPLRQSPPRVAVLYSGRWLGASASHEMVANHMEHLILPSAATVFVVVDPLNWCDAGSAAHVAFTRQPTDVVALEAALCADVDAAFRAGAAATRSAGSAWRVHCTYAESELERDAAAYGRAGFDEAARYGVRSAHVGAMLRVWWEQFTHVARAELLRRAHGPHDIVVRARLDVAFGALVRPAALQLSPRVVYALPFAGWTRAGAPRSHLRVGGECRPAASGLDFFDAQGRRMRAPCPRTDGSRAANGSRIVTWMWRDWVYAGSPEAFAPLAEMAASGAHATTSRSRADD